MHNNKHDHKLKLRININNCTFRNTSNCLLAIILISAVVILTACSEESATPPQIPDVPAAEISAIDSNESNNAVADKCQECHGVDGVNGKPNVPFIAGQYREYLTTALNNYKSNQRNHDDMHVNASTLDELQINRIAEYYANLRTQWVPPTVKTEDNQYQVKKKLIASGAKKAKACESCHGIYGNSEKENVPNLAILQPEYFNKALREYINGARKDVYMNNFKHALNDDDIKQLAAYFTSQQARKTPHTDSSVKPAAQSHVITQCAGCHGMDGNSGNPMMPSLAGQPQPYLVKAIKYYQTGARKDEFMQKAVERLTDNEINKFAAFFASQTPTEFQSVLEKKSQGFDPLGEATLLATSCDACHGKQGNTQTPGTPRLSALPRDYFITAIDAYKNSTRKHDMMQLMVKSLSDDDVEKLALYYAVQSPALKTKLPKNVNITDAENLAGSCNGCHGDKGISTQQGTPSIAGQDFRYLINAIKAYKNNSREHSDMQNAVKEITDETVRIIAAYYAQQTLQAIEVSMPRAPEEIAEQCDRCHVGNGNGHNPKVPKINGQLFSYLEKTLNQYKNDTRKNSAMHAMSAELSRLEIKAVAELYSQRPPLK